MAKQQFNFSLSESQLRQACEAYVSGMVDVAAYDLEATVKAGSHVLVKATKKRTRKAKAAAPAKGAA